jgi:hypothetical protein
MEHRAGLQNERNQSHLFGHSAFSSHINFIPRRDSWNVSEKELSRVAREGGGMSSTAQKMYMSGIH